MTMLYSTQGTITFPIKSGNTLVINNISGTETVTGFTVGREDATSSIGPGTYVYGPQIADCTLTLATTGQCDYQIVAGDPTPSDTPFLFNHSNYSTSPAGSAAVAAATFASGAVGLSNPDNHIWALGDSITANGNAAPTASTDWLFYGQSYLQWACALSVGKLHFGGVSALGGINSGTCIQTYLPAVLAAKPRFCVVHIGTNDYGSPGYANDGSTTRQNLLTIYTTLLQNGIIPIATAFLPKNTLVNAPSSVLQRLTLWVAATARKLGIPYCDWTTPDMWAATGDGSWTSAAYSADGTHPTEMTAVKMAQALLTAITPWLAPSDSYFSKVQNNSNLTSHTPSNTNGLQLTDTNADGLADGWNGTGNGTASLVAMTASEGLGNWQVMTGASATSSMQRYGNNVAMIPGNQIMVACKFKSSVNAVGGKFTLRFCDANSNPIAAMIDMTTDVTLGAFCRTFAWPSGAATNFGRMEVLVKGVNAVVQIGQLMVIDLTANGLTV